MDSRCESSNVRVVQQRPVTGSCEFILDNGVKRETLKLDSPTKGLVIGPMIWREMQNFSEDCVLVVIASENYDESDYIRNYKRFKNET